MSLRCIATSFAALVLLMQGGCRDPVEEVTDTTAGSSSGDGTVSVTSPAATSTGPSPDATTGDLDGTGETTGIATGGGSSSGGSSSDDGGTTLAIGGSTTIGIELTTGGPVSTVGCADGEREALIDEVAFPMIAACSGGFGIPGVGYDTPTCGRMGGDDGPFPDGMPCSVDDLCADGWHVCISRQEVMASGIASCNGLTWSTGFFITAQSGEGSNTCADTGTNDVFGCGDIGYTNISGCAPLNNSTSNECVKLAGPWSCPGLYVEKDTIMKTGPDYGGALCCLDGA